jgi:putative F0F1-ATPase subunit (Ca2+/Mg2+ transporter)
VASGNPMMLLSQRDSSVSAKSLQATNLQIGLPKLRCGSGHDCVRLRERFRFSSEFVAGVIVGAGIGWLIDRALGISPWGLTVFLLLGFAAGVLNVMRSAGIAPK